MRPISLTSYRCRLISFRDVRLTSDEHGTATKRDVVVATYDRGERSRQLSLRATIEMRGREMKGWLRVDAESVSTKRALEPWAMQSVAFARALPPKEKK